MARTACTIQGPSGTPVQTRTMRGETMRRLAILALLTGPFMVPAASAHPGGLNGEGCHNNRKTGDYQCHGGGRASRPAPSRQLLSSSSGTFRNCSEARAAGAAPVRRGDPGYARHLDRDGDGIGCE